jgi:hypothetical protein
VMSEEALGTHRRERDEPFGDEELDGHIMMIDDVAKAMWGPGPGIAFGLLRECVRGASPSPTSCSASLCPRRVTSRRSSFSRTPRPMRSPAP